MAVGYAASAIELVSFVPLRTLTYVGGQVGPSHVDSSPRRSVKKLLDIGGSSRFGRESAADRLTLVQQLRVGRFSVQPLLRIRSRVDHRDRCTVVPRGLVPIRRSAAQTRRTGAPPSSPSENPDARSH